MTSGTATHTLAAIRRLFAALHQSTNFAPIRLSASSDPIDNLDAVLSQPLSYPSCNNPSHRPHSSALGLAPTSPSVPPRIKLRDSPQASPRPTSVSQPPLVPFPQPAAEHAVPGNVDFAVISDTAESIRVSRGGPSREQVEEDRTTPPPAVFGPLPTPIPSPAFSSHIPVTSSMYSTMTPLTSGAPFATSSTGPWSVSPHVITGSGQYPGVNNGTAGSQGDTQDVRPPIPRGDDG